jgi:glycerol-3-phosphate dehydrogenase (NAD(P)+)
MSVKFAILGDGAWGTAVAIHLAQNPDHRVFLWSARADNGRLLQQRRENVRLLPGVAIPPEVELTTDIKDTAGADLWITAIPTLYLRETVKRAAALAGTTPVLSLTKGLENETFLRPSEILSEVLGPRPVAVLSGPSHAEEVSRGLPTTLVAACRDIDLSVWVQERFSTNRFRVYTNQDVIGVELGAAVKNIIGIAAGINDGLALGDNAKSALITRGLVEMARFGVALGADHHTISAQGLNRRVGQQLGAGARLPDIVAGMSMVAEGVSTARSVHEKALKLGIEMPITAEVFRVLYENKDPRRAVTDLMMRDPTSERL